MTTGIYLILQQCGDCLWF